MSSQSALLQSGLEALQNSRYREAIYSLEAFCRQCPDPGSKDAIQAKMSLVKAYQRTRQLEKAIALSRQLAANENPKVQTWAQQALQSLEIEASTDAKTANNPLQAGHEALKQQRYAEAVAFLEEFCQSSPEQDSHDYLQALMWLVKAYRENGQVEQAIALCQQLAASENLKAQAWAQRLLPSLSPSGESELTPEQADELLKAGNQALKQQQYAEAIEALEAYCHGSEPSAKDYAQAQMWLVKAYKGNGQKEDAIALCQQLTTNEDPLVQSWAQQFLPSLAHLPAYRASSTSEDAPPDSIESTPEEKGKSFPKAGRSPKLGVKLAMKGVAANLSLASGVTLSLLSGMVLVLSLSLILILGSDNPLQGLIFSVFITLIFNSLVFFLAPFLMDLMQGMLYGTRWVSLSEIERHSPETGRVIRQVCQQKKLQQPRLGIIDDQNPTAFTYGSLPNSARLVVSEGLFTYLDDDEVATVYAHELGHIVHWDFAIMTLAATLVQITYLIYTFAREFAEKLGNGETSKKIKGGLQTAALTAYMFYIVGEYLLLYLSRTREYYADHFAAETTGNPNGLSRALVKIAYGILEEGQRTQQPSKLIQGTRALGIYDAKAATFTGTAYRVASDPAKVGNVFLWDMCNPWGWWMELNSTHPLTGKRVRALSTYAEQLGLETEFDMARVVRESRTLNKKRLYGSFVFDLIIYKGEYLGFVIGLLLAFALSNVAPISWKVFASLSTIGFGLGTLIKTLLMYPDFNRAPATDILTLMSDPYASPLRGRPVRLAGEVIGRANPGYKFGSDFKLQDPTGTIYVHYASRFGPLGNFLFGMTQTENLFTTQVKAVGWFRRGIMPWLDLIKLESDRLGVVNSYHRFWSAVLGFGAIVLGFVMPSLL